LRGVEAALAAANARLAAKGIRFADVKGISAGFTEAIGAPLVSAPNMPSIGRPDGIRGFDGSGAVTVNVTGGLATSAEIGGAVVNALRAYNRSSGPAQFEIA
jgi:hypothetical protein